MVAYYDCVQVVVEWVVDPMGNVVAWVDIEQGDIGEVDKEHMVLVDMGKADRVGLDIAVVVEQAGVLLYLRLVWPPVWLPVLQPGRRQLVVESQEIPPLYIVNLVDR